MFCAALLLISTTPIFFISYSNVATEPRENGVEGGGVRGGRVGETSPTNNEHSSLRITPSSSTTTTSLTTTTDYSQQSVQYTPSTEKDKSIHQSDTRRSGYTLALSFHDQQTWALGNLYSLQNWAYSLNMSVLEPFLLSTTLGLPREMSPSCLPLSTLYNMNFWNENVKWSGNSVTVKWDQFITSAPKNMILVQTDPNIRRCTTENMKLQVSLLIKAFGFKVVHEICLSRPPISVEQFNRKILGNFSADDVSVVFSEWSQNTAGTVLDLTSAHMPMALSATLPLHPSAMITNNAQSYISKFLNDGKFIAMLFRSEWLTMYSSVAIFNNTLQGCVSKALDYIHKAKEKTGAEQVFLGLDVGRFGSKTVEPEKKAVALKTFEQQLVPVTQFSSFTNWEESFERVGQYPVPGYIAHLQRTIAMESSCLLLMGSGSFLKQALDHYKILKPHLQCYIETDGRCNVFRKSGF